MHRFFVSPDQIGQRFVRFDDDQAHQMRRVLRLRPGDRVLALDGLGNQYEVTLEEVSHARVTGSASAAAAATGEPSARLTLYQSILRREKFEWVLQKGTEIGIAAFIPVITRRSLVRDAEDVRPEKLDRWRRIIKEAAEQSGRGRLPALHPPISFSEAGPAAWFLTLTGCLGMTGLSADGVGVTINNLSSTDGQVGVVWPALVRAMLASGSAMAARRLLEATRLSSGHHYMMADGREFFGVETSGRQKVVTQVSARAAHLHTNHCFDPVLRKVERVPRVSTTYRRFDLATTLYVQQRPRDPQGVWDFLASHEGYPRSLCSHVDDDAGGDPSASRTCGMMVMQLAGGAVLAGAGCGQEAPPRRETLGRWRGTPAIDGEQVAIDAEQAARRDL